MKAKLSTIATLVGLAFVAAPAAEAQVKLTLKAAGSADKQVDLDPTSVLSVDAQGNVTATYLSPLTGVCLGTACAGTGGGSGKPTVSLTPPTASITANQSVNLQWQAGNGADICVATSGFPNLNAILSHGDGSHQLSVQFPSESGSPFTLGLACYNENGISTTATSVVTVAPAGGSGGGGTGTGCDITSTDSNFQPSNLARITSSFNQEFGAAFPNSGSTPLYGVGSNANTYKSLAFVPAAGTAYRISWDGAQYSANNPDPEPASSAIFTISPCPGDFRAPASPVPDATMISACRRVGQANTINFGSVGCVLEPGRTYYLNLTMKSSYAQIPTSSHSCGASAFCEVNVQLN